MNPSRQRKGFGSPKSEGGHQMKKLFYPMSSRRSFARLLPLLACVALAPLFAQQAMAQEFEFGWEPFPPSSWDGGWDASLRCKAVEGTTTLDRTPESGPVVLQEGKVSCTFTDTARNFQETASCLLRYGWANLKAECIDNKGSSTLTVTGQCPYQNGDGILGASLTGTINCEGGGPDGANPTFCTYAGDNPEGNEGNFCTWNVGFGKKQEVEEGLVVVPLTQQECIEAFGEPVEESRVLSSTQTPTVFSSTFAFAGPACEGSSSGLGTTEQRFCHSDTWDPAQAAFCDLSRPETIGTSSVVNHLTADTEYTPETINRKCPNNGVITLRVFANNVDPNTNPVAVQEIDQDSITVNGRPIIPGSCNLTIDRLQCKARRCEGEVSIVEHTIVPGTKTATLQMRAVMEDGSVVVGDVETKKVV